MRAASAPARGSSPRRHLRQGWLVLAGHFGEVQTLMIVSLVYVFAIGPSALVSALGGRDLLAKRGFAESTSAWRASDSTATPNLERAKRLF